MTRLPAVRSSRRVTGGSDARFLGGGLLGGAAGGAAGVLTDEDDVNLGKPVWRR
jgi:hypothetical protein